MKILRKNIFVAAMLIATALFTSDLIAAETETDNPVISADELDQHIRDYILKHPEVLVQSIQQWQAQQQQAQIQQAKAAIKDRHDELFNDPSAPIGGNPNGDVTVVEFMDYNCAYCRRVFPAVKQLVESDSKVRLLFKEFPILGSGSEFAARAALASRKQGRYVEFHNAMMQAKKSLEERQVLAIAERVNLDVEQLRQDMKDPEIQAIIDRNFELAQALSISGTPGFVIGDEIVRGATSLANLQGLIEQVRQTKK